MDYNIYIIVSVTRLNELDIVEEKRNWLDEDYSYSPQRFTYKDEVEFISADYPFRNLIPSMDNPICLKITHGIQELEWISNKSSCIENNCIIKFLKNLLILDSYYIYIFEDDMPINIKIAMNDSIDIEKIIRCIFNWDNPENILIYRE